MPSTSWQDNFTGSNNTGLGSHSPDTGSGGYTVQTGALQLISNKLQATSYGYPGFGSAAYASFDSGAPTSTITFDLSLQSFMGVSDSALAIVRYDASANSGFLVRVEASVLTLYQMSNGSASWVDYTSLSLSYATNYTLTIENTSSGVSATVDGASVDYSSTTGNDKTGIAVGIGASMGTNSGTTIDNLSVSTPPTASELYATYLAAVESANADYLDAVADRDAAIVAARVAAQTDADQLYADYEDTVAATEPTYDAAVAAAETDYDDALADANADWESATADARADYEEAMEDAQDAYDAAIAALDADYDDSIAAADADYEAYIAPFEEARDDTYAAWQLDPENEELEEAYNDAQDDLDAAIVTATAQRDDDYDAASETRQDGVSLVEDDWVDAEAAAADDFDTESTPAREDWVDAEAAAWTSYVAAMSDADDSFLDSEQSASTVYSNGVASIEADLETTEGGIEEEFAVTVATAVSAWETAEGDAWDTYETAMAAIPGTPELDTRIETPQDAAPFSLTLAQVPPVALAIFLARVYNVTDTFRGQVRTRVLAHIASTNRGTDTYAETGIAAIFLESGQTALMEEAVDLARARLATARHTNIMTTAAAMATVTAQIEYVVQNYATTPRSGNVDFRVIFRVTITSTAPNGAARTSVVRVSGGSTFYDSNLRTREGLTAGP